MHIIQDKNQYFSLIQDFQYIPFTQSEGWYHFHACMKPDSILFFVDNEESPRIACFGHIKRFFGLTMLMVEGECYKINSLSADIIQAFYSDIRMTGFEIVETSSSAKYDSYFEMGIRRAGYLRPVGLFSTPLTVWVNTDREIVYDRNWKRNLKKAFNSELVFEAVVSPEEKDAKNFVAIYNNMSGFKGFNHQLTLIQVKALLEDTSMKLFQVRDTSGHLLSMRIVYQHTHFATDVYAANNPLGRECGAAHFMMDNIFQNLKRGDIKVFDFARVLYDNGSLNSVAQFKNGAKGDHILYNGEWSWYKYPLLRPLMYFVKRFVMKKREV